MPASAQSMLKTHYNYIKCVGKQVNGIDITTPLRPTVTLSQDRVKKFENLARLTEASIRSEIDACFREPEYSQVVAPWMPVKCYYRIYYLESVLLYLLNNSEVGFSHGGHTGVRKGMRAAVEAGQLIFSNAIVSENKTVGDVATHTIRSGANLAHNFYDTDDCIGSVRKKVAEYMELNFKEREKISAYRSRVDKAKRDTFYTTQKVNLTDFFYWMRIKANYKDIDYLDFENDITADDAYKYINEYAAAQDIYAFALQQLIDELKASRSMTDATPRPLT